MAFEDALTVDKNCKEGLRLLGHVYQANDQLDKALKCFQRLNKIDPKDKEAMFSLLRVHFFQGYLRDMYLEDNLGQTTRIEFTRITKNQKLADDVFNLKLDDSVDIIEEP